MPAPRASGSMPTKWMYATSGSVCETNPHTNPTMPSCARVDRDRSGGGEVLEEQPRKQRRHLPAAPPVVDARDHVLVVARFDGPQLDGARSLRRPATAGADTTVPSSAVRSSQYGTTAIPMWAGPVEVADDSDVRRLVEADEHDGVGDRVGERAVRGVVDDRVAVHRATRREHVECRTTSRRTRGTPPRADG